MWEKGKLLERSAGVAESSGWIQVKVKPKILRVDWEWSLLTVDWQFQRPTKMRGAAEEVQIGRSLARLRCCLRVMLERCWERTWMYCKLMFTYYHPPDSAWAVRKNTLTWEDFFLISLKCMIVFLITIFYCTIEYNISKAGVCWEFWHNMAAVASSRWMLLIGGGWGDSPFHVKRFEYPEKRYINVMN